MAKILRVLVSASIVVVAYLNLWQLNQTLRWVKPREADDVVVLEDRLRFIRNALMKAGYWRGDVGYMPAAVLNGAAPTARNEQVWTQVRYVMIPWNVVQDSLNPPYVLVDSTGVAQPVEIPAGFGKIYDSKDGLMLLKKQVRQ